MSLRSYVAESWHVVEPGRRFVPNWHIDAICDHLEALSRGAIRDLVINIPPRTSKSTIVSVDWPTWEWSFAPYTRWLFSSYAQRLSTRDSVKSRRVIDSPWYQRRWGKVYQLTSDQNEKTRFENDKTGMRIATSVTGSGTGEGGDRIVVDDPHNVKEAESEAKRVGTLEWWDEVMSTRGNDPATRARVIVMQRVHESDLTGHVIASELGYEHLVLPMEYDPKRSSVTVIGFTDPRRIEGELLWPARFPAKEVASLKKTLGPYAYAAQMQQEPAPSKGAIFDKTWFRFYTTRDRPIIEDGVPVHTIPDALNETIQSWDMSFKGERDSDFVVGDVWSRSGANVYLRHEVRDQWELPETLTAVVELSQLWPQALAKYVEDKANGPAVIQTLRNKVPGLIPLDPSVLGAPGDLIARGRAVAPLCAAGNVFIPHPDIATFDVGAWLVEIQKFPRATKDDRVATLAQALIVLIQNMVGSRWREQLVGRKPGEDRRSEAGRAAAQRF